MIYNFYPCTPVLVYVLDNCMHELAGSLIIWLTSHLRRASKQLKPDHLEQPPPCSLQDINAGEIRAVSFSAAPASIPAGAEAGDTNLFVAPDFMVATAGGSIQSLRAVSFDDPLQAPVAHSVILQVRLRLLHSFWLCAWPCSCTR